MTRFLVSNDLIVMWLSSLLVPIPRRHQEIQQFRWLSCRGERWAGQQHQAHMADGPQGSVSRATRRVLPLRRLLVRQAPFHPALPYWCSIGPPCSPLLSRGQTRYVLGREQVEILGNCLSFIAWEGIDLLHQYSFHILETALMFSPFERRKIRVHVNFAFVFQACLTWIVMQRAVFPCTAVGFSSWTRPRTSFPSGWGS